MKKIFTSLMVMVIMFLLSSTPMVFAQNGSGNPGGLPGDIDRNYIITERLVQVISSVFATGITNSTLGASGVMGVSYNKSTASAMTTGINPMTALTTTNTFGFSRGTMFNTGNPVEGTVLNTGMFDGGFQGQAQAQAQAQRFTYQSSFLPVPSQ